MKMGCRKKGEVVGGGGVEWGRRIVPCSPPLPPSSRSSSHQEKERGRTNASHGSLLLVSVGSAGPCVPPTLPTTTMFHLLHTHAHTHTRRLSLSSPSSLSLSHIGTQPPRYPFPSLALSHSSPPHLLLLHLLPICDKLSDSSSPSDCRL